ncbi:MAG: class I SAM-dependent methyltransferase [bacterium]|nr:class I SAM-dependent methyltransferase [bacterium]
MKVNLGREELEALFRNERYPLSGKYDPQWILDNALGSQCLWLAESLTQIAGLEPGARVLDLGCGKAITSIFLAREFGVEVWAVDLTASPTENHERIRQAGVEQLVFPLRGDARSLPFADAFFDFVLSVNALHLFGTDDYYVPQHLARLLRPGCRVAFTVPGLIREYGEAIPEHVKPFWLDHVIAYHSPRWWRGHLEKTGLFRVQVSDNLPDGQGVDIWRFWAQGEDDALIEDDNGDNISFVRVLAERS